MEIIEPANENVETPISTQEKNEILFNGSGIELLGISLLNMVLTVFSLGLYYPWARVAKLRFVYQNTLLNNTRFVFSGTGKELFKGFIKFFAALIIVYVIYFFLISKNDVISQIAGSLILAVFFILIVPLAIHGAMRYGLSRTSWRGIHFGYRGNRNSLFYLYLTNLVLTVFTLGIYQSWFTNNLRKYIIGEARFGNIRFGYTGKGSELFMINLKGLILTPLTFGLYYFWYRIEYLDYLIENTYLEQYKQQHFLKTDYIVTEYLGLSIVNFLIVVFSFGLAAPFAEVRLLHFLINKVELPDAINFNEINQTEDDYQDATGDDVLDYLDIGIA